MDQYDTNPPPTLLTLGQIPWAVQWVRGLTAKLGEHFTVDLDGGLSIAEDTPQDAVLQAASYLKETVNKSSQIIRVLNRFLGDLILWYGAKHRITDGEAIDALGLVEATERKMSTLKKLPRIARKLSPQILALEGLTFSHYDAATSFAGPGEPDKIRAWQERVEDILRKAAENPGVRNRAWVADSMRELQKDFDISPSRPVASGVLYSQYAKINYILEHWTPDHFEEAGQERAKVIDWRVHIENELLNRGLLEIPDPQNFVPPWNPEKPTEAADIGEDEEEQEEPRTFDLPPGSVTKVPDISAPPQDGDSEEDLLPIQ